MKNIAVTIPTLNEESSLPECLQCLSGQLRDGDEVIVVDGGSEDETIEVAKQAGCKVYVAEGSSIGEARHIAAKEAETEVIATTDADARPPNNWIKKIRSHFNNDDSLAVLWGNIHDKNGVPIRNLIGKFSTLVGGASGNNTAYSKWAYREVENAYPNVSFAEDFAAIAKLATVGKAVRDKNLLMVMDMDRSRYQTKPIMGASAITAAVGYVTGGELGKMAIGTAVGMAGTETTYENATGTPFHHDQIGGGVFMLGEKISERRMTGIGAGMVAHHILTEGLSALPTTLQRETNEVIE
jgi:hypothetical protein